VFDSVVIDQDGRSATLQGCHWDTDIVESAGPVIINDERGSFHQTVALSLDEGRWRVTRKDTERYLLVVNDCGARL
jgi:hypothetical protein